jgi:hypothetical protein
MNNKEVKNKQNNKSEKPKMDHEGFRRTLVQLHKPDINKKHIEKAAGEINKKLDSHFNGTSKGRSMKEMPEDKSVLSTVKNVVLREMKKNISEAVTVKKSTHSWGKMITVHHGSSHSFPLHPEHQEKIAKLKDGESTSFTDETNSKVTAHREGDTVHLSLRGSNTKTPVAMSHFKEEVEQVNELSKDTLKSYVKKALDPNTSLNANSEKSIVNLAARSGYERGEVGRKYDHKAVVRSHGVQRAVNKLTKEEADLEEGIGKTIAAGILAAGIGAGVGATADKMIPKSPHYQVKQIGSDYNVYRKNNVGGKIHYSSKNKDDAVKWVMQKEELELDEAKRGRPRKDGSKPSGDEEGGREHIIVQLRKAENLRGNRQIEFNDNTKHTLPLSHIKKALDMHLKMKPIPKGDFEAHIAKSHKHFNDVVVHNKPVETEKKKGVTLAKFAREQVEEDWNTVRTADRGDIIPIVYRDPVTGKAKVIKRREPRAEIKIEAKDQFAKQYLSPEETEEKKEGQTSPKGVSFDMTADSRNKMKSDLLFSKVKLNLPPSVSNKASGGEDAVYGSGKYSVAEEKTLNSLYEDLSEQNKDFFNDLMQTEDGIVKLLQFAKEQGY